MNIDDIKSRFDTELFEIKISRIQGAGYGVFAKKNIQVGVRLGEYTGEIIDINNVHKYDIKNLSNSQYVFKVSDKRDTILIDAGEKYIKKTNWTRFVNTVLDIDSPKLNVYSYQYGKKLYYKALRDIKKGEELLTYYGINHISKYI